MNRQAPGSLSAAWALVAAGLFLAVVTSPIRENFKRKPRDGFPLSYYPMFSQKRGSTGNVVHLVADRDDGSEVPVQYSFAGSGGFNQIRRQIRRRAKTRAGADALASEVLERVTKRGIPAVRVRVQRSEYSYDQYFAGRREPVRTRTLGSSDAS